MPEAVLPPPEHADHKPVNTKKRLIIVVVVILLLCCLVCAVITILFGTVFNQGFGDFSKQFEDQFGDKVKQYENQLHDLNGDDSGFSLFGDENWPADLPASVPEYTYADITTHERIGRGGVQGTFWIITAAKSTPANLQSYKNDLTLKNWLIKSQTNPQVLDASLEADGLLIQIVLQADKTEITVTQTPP